MIVEWALLADYVELSGNKLYLMGGGWDSVVINNHQFTHMLGVAATFRAEERELDRAHAVAIQIHHVDTQATIMDVHGNVEFGSLPEHSRLDSELAHFGVNVTLRFESEGLYHLVIREDAQVLKTFPFQVAFGAALRRA